MVALERRGAGKTFMVRAGAFDGVDAALTWHPAPSMVSDPQTTLRFSSTIIGSKALPRMPPMRLISGGQLSMPSN